MEASIDDYFVQKISIGRMEVDRRFNQRNGKSTVLVVLSDRKLARSLYQFVRVRVCCVQTGFDEMWGSYCQIKFFRKLKRFE